MMKSDDFLRNKLEAFDRVSLIHLPTPMRKLERLSAELGGPEIWIKRDDLTGLAFGGNKSRKLEYIIPDVLSKKAEVVVTWGSLQSNWTMQTAAACAKFGLHSVLVLFKTYDLPPELDGNMLLNHLLGADMWIKPAVKGKIVTQDFALAAANERGAGERRVGNAVSPSERGPPPGFSPSDRFRPILLKNSLQ